MHQGKRIHGRKHLQCRVDWGNKFVLNNFWKDMVKNHFMRLGVIRE